MQVGRFPRLDDRDDLWQVLLLLIRQKVQALREHEHREKRGGGTLQHFSALAGPDRCSAEEAFAECFASGPSPALAAEVAEEVRRLLEMLEDGELRTIAVCKMEGYTNEEISARLDCSLATVERRLRLIRKKWARSSTDAAKPPAGEEGGRSSNPG